MRRRNQSIALANRLLVLFDVLSLPSSVARASVSSHSLPLLLACERLSSLLIVCPSCISSDTQSLPLICRGSKGEEEDDSDGGFKRRPKLRTTIARDQRYTWAAGAPSCRVPVASAGQAAALVTGVGVGSRGGLPPTLSPDPLIVAHSSSFVDRYAPRDPGLAASLAPHSRQGIPCPHQQRNQQYRVLPSAFSQQETPATQISPDFQLIGRQVNGCPLSIHQLPIYPHQISNRIDVSPDPFSSLVL